MNNVYQTQLVCTPSSEPMDGFRQGCGNTLPNLCHFPEDKSRVERKTSVSQMVVFPQT